MVPDVLSSILTLVLMSAELECTSVAGCNRIGTEALQQGRIEAARDAFVQQIDHAETALKLADTVAERQRLAHALQIALNNAALAALSAGDCRMARAWLQVADTEHKATRANDRARRQRCGESSDPVEMLGEFLQYAGHGAWNSVSIRETGDETLRLDAFWMRIGRGPLSEWGPAAIGDLSEVYLHVDGLQARGGYAGLAPEVDCEVQIRFVPAGLEIVHTAASECRMGGAGAELQGHYWRVGEVRPLPNDAAP